MPGTHFYFSREHRIQREDFLQSLKHILYEPTYDAEIYTTDPDSLLGITKYQEYPVDVFEYDDYLLVIEGYLYGLSISQTKQSLYPLAELVFSGTRDINSHIKNWVYDHDGDFFIAFYDKKKNQWSFLNDTLGRLPVYLYQNDHRFLLTRDFSLIAPLLNLSEFDSMAIAQYLLFGFSIGDRTFLKNVKRLPPASLCRQTVSGDFSFEQYHVFDFNRRDDSKDANTSLTDLTDLFIDGCTKMTSGYNKNILTLSGGLDSRTIAAGAKKAGIELECYTFEDHYHSNIPDVSGAEQISRALSYKWHKFMLPPPTGKELSLMLKIKGGMNYLSSAFTLPFMHQIEKECGKGINYLSGDGGHSVLPNLNPFPKLKSDRAMVMFAINRLANMSLDTVSRLTGVSPEDFYSELEQLVATYPELSYNHKYIHFLIYERGMRWAYEGEDCNRCFFWSCTPFYDIKFFDYAMSIPDSIKKNYRFYGAFINNLSAEVASVTDANRGVSILSEKYVRKIAMASYLTKYPKLFRRIKSIMQPPLRYQQSDVIFDCLNRQTAHCDNIKNYINIERLDEFKKNGKYLSKDNVDNIFTIVSAIELFTNGISSLDNYQDTIFM